MYCMISIIIANGQEMYTNSIGMEFIKIHEGDYISSKFHPTVSRMKSWGSDVSLNESVYHKAMEMAHHDAMHGFKVFIKKPFYIGKFEVTQDQWISMMGKNPSYFQHMNVTDSADQHPVENITFKLAMQFINKLNALEKGKAQYRLPTEFEWEYAARADMVEDISWADIQASAFIAHRTTSRIGQMKPNAWGIYDMLGNVWEWTQDYYNNKIFADSIPPAHGKQHVLKGASFFADVKNATYMTHAAGPGSGYDVGLRLVIVFIK